MSSEKEEKKRDKKEDNCYMCMNQMAQKMS